MTKKGLSRLVASVLVIAVTFIMPVPVFADSGACTTAHPIKIGKRAPCTGLLITEADAKAALSCIQADLPSLRIDYDALKLESAENDKKSKALLDLERTKSKRLQELLDEAAKIPPEQVLWYESPYFFVSVGFVGGAVFMFGAVYAATELSR